MLTCTAEIEGCKGGHEETCRSWRRRKRRRGTSERRLLGSRAELLCEVGDEVIMGHGDLGNQFQE